MNPAESIVRLSVRFLFFTGALALLCACNPLTTSLERSKIHSEQEQSVARIEAEGKARVAEAERDAAIGVASQRTEARKEEAHYRYLIRRHVSNNMSIVIPFCLIFLVGGGIIFYLIYATKRERLALIEHGYFDMLEARNHLAAQSRPVLLPNEFTVIEQYANRNGWKVQRRGGEYYLVDISGQGRKALQVTPKLLSG